MASHPCFIVLDGPEAAGKTTQLKMLKYVVGHRYPGRQLDFTHEPGGTPFADLIRGVVLHDVAASVDGVELVQAYGAARFNHVRTRIVPALKEGKVVVSDRFDAATWAYQIVAQRGGENAAAFFKIQRQLLLLMLASVGVPHWTTIILDVDVDTTMARIAERIGEQNHFDTQTREFHDRVRFGFRTYKLTYSSSTHVISGSLTPDLVHEDIIAILDRLLGGPSQTS